MRVETDFKGRRAEQGYMRYLPRHDIFKNLGIKMGSLCSPYCCDVLVLVSA